MLLFGKQPEINRQMINSTESESKTLEEYSREVNDAITAAYHAVKHNTDKYLRYKEILFDRTKSKELNIGDLVLLWIPTRKVGVSAKLMSPWSLPFKIIGQINEAIFEIEMLDWSAKRLS